MKNLVLFSFFAASNAKLLSDVDHKNIFKDDALITIEIVVPIEEEIFPLDAIDFITDIASYSDDLEIDLKEDCKDQLKNNDSENILQKSDTIIEVVEVVLDSCHKSNDFAEMIVIKNDDKKLLKIIETEDDTFEYDSAQEDDIVPVPHELINSVKKAHKKKKRLEQKQRKEKYKIFKKSKKKK